MSTRTAPSSMTPRGRGVGRSSSSSPWQRQRPSGMGGNGGRLPSQKPRGYSVPNNKSRRPPSSSSHQHSPSHGPPPQIRQERGDSSSYYRNDGGSAIYNRDKDQEPYRQNRNDYRQNGFERGPSRFDDRERNTDNTRGQGYDDRPPIYDRRGMGDHGNITNTNFNDRRYDENFRGSRDKPLYNSNGNNRRPPSMGVGDYSDDRRRPMGRGDDHGYRDSTSDHRGNFEERGSFGREQERELYNDNYQRQQHRPHADSNAFRDHPGESDRYSSGYSAGREERKSKGGMDDGNFRRSDYNDRGAGQQQQQWPREPEQQRWRAPSTASRGDEYHNNSGSNNNASGCHERNGFSNHRPGMSDTRAGETRERIREGNEPFRGEWGQRQHPAEEAPRGYSMGGDRRPDRSVPASGNREYEDSDARWGHRDRETASGQPMAPRGDDRYYHQQSYHNREEPRSGEHGRADSSATTLQRAPGGAHWTDDNRSRHAEMSPRRYPASDTRGRDPVRSSWSPGDGGNPADSRKRQREDDGESRFAVTTKVEWSDERTPTKEASTPNHVQSFPAIKSETTESNPKQGSGDGKKIKLSNGAPAPVARHIYHYKTEAKQQELNKDTKVEVPKGASSSSSPSNDKSNTNSIPVKPSSSKQQLQAKPKPSSKLGIPMRWLKPKAKPKPVKKDPPKAPEDTSKSTTIPFKAASNKTSASRPSSPPNRLVTDSSEGSSIVSYKNNAKASSSSSSTVHTKKQKGTSVPAAIVTKQTKKASKAKTKQKAESLGGYPEQQDEEWDSEAQPEESDGGASDSESDTDDDEVLDWASKMLGVPASPSSVQPTDSNDPLEPSDSQNKSANDVAKSKSPKLKIRLSAALKNKLSESIQSSDNSNGLSVEDGNKLEAALKKLERSKKKQEKLKAFTEKINEREAFDNEKVRMEIEENRRKREEAKPLTAKEIRKILREDTSSVGDQGNWVRRSRRQPNMALLNSKPVRILVDKLKYNDTDMLVLKMKKYINDPNTPCAVMDAILNAMEENTNCEALYIQNFNEGIRDDQVIHLLRILQQPSCKIWCLNIGENYNVSDSTWERFTKGLIHTKITHMYASEHTITSDMKDEIRFTIRENRKKHDMHINPNNLDVIIQCTHCWWNPINAKVLRPFLKKKGYEHVLKDKEAQGLQGSNSMAPTA